MTFLAEDIYLRMFECSRSEFFLNLKICVRLFVTLTGIVKNVKLNKHTEEYILNLPP
jgi:hypothetical protein